MTYPEIAALDPRISQIVDGLRPARGQWARWKQYEATKNKLSDLVGFGATTPALSTPAAYECAVQEVTRRLRL